ncbi:MAG TPA: hypothetical protein DEV81_11335 [Cyanobacteria bacterium UBA11049]|nr:hypothetical protein [Cyanobacteria bacterium UBA11049]
MLVVVLAYQLFTSKHDVANNTQAVPLSTTPLSTPAQNPTASGNDVNSTAPVTSPAPNTTASVPTASIGIQPRQFVQSAFGNKAEVELLKVNRIPGQPNAVNVQFRLRAIRADKGTYEDNIYLPNTTASDPNTGATYKPIKGQGTDNIPPLKSMYNDKLPSVDGYIWLQIPEEVNTVDIQLPNTGVFKNVPISQPSTASIQATGKDTVVQPGQFVKYAFKNKAQVELLKVNRIPGERGVVNVQVRIRPIKREEGTWSDYISMSNTTARDPNTSEAFKAVPDKSTDREHITSLKEMDNKNLTSLDAYVWLSIPEGINIIDIYFPNTQAFTNVPISSQ